MQVDPLALRNGVIFTVATLLFVTAVARGWLPFALATSAFMSLTTMLLSNSFRWRDAVFGAVIGLALGVVLQFTFTRILFIDLTGVTAAGVWSEAARECYEPSTRGDRAVSGGGKGRRPRMADMPARPNVNRITVSRAPPPKNKTKKKKKKKKKKK